MVLFAEINDTFVAFANQHFLKVLYQVADLLKLMGRERFMNYVFGIPKITVDAQARQKNIHFSIEPAFVKTCMATMLESKDLEDALVPLPISL